MIRLHARHAQRALEQTLEASKTDNVELKAQVYLNYTSGCIVHLPRKRLHIAAPYLNECLSGFHPLHRVVNIISKSSALNWDAAVLSLQSFPNGGIWKPTATPLRIGAISTLD